MKKLESIMKTCPFGRAGFSLTELLVVIVIVGLLIGWRLPSFHRFLERSKVEGTTQELIMDIQLARSLAITRHRTYQMRFTDHRYRIVDTSDGTIVRERNVPNQLTFVASADPNFRSGGFADPANITITGSYGTRTLTLLPTGSVNRQ